MTISNLLKTAIVSLLAVANLSIPAFASSDIHFDSNVYMERAVRIQGQTQRQLVVPPYIARGDHLVLKTDYQNAGTQPSTAFEVTNPVPPMIAYDGGATPGAEFSVDGGQSWGALETLTVIQADGSTRAANNADVTHIRWMVAETLYAGDTGMLSFRGVVR